MKHILEDFNTLASVVKGPTVDMAQRLEEHHGELQRAVIGLMAGITSMVRDVQYIRTDLTRADLDVRTASHVISELQLHRDRLRELLLQVNGEPPEVLGLSGEGSAHKAEGNNW